MKRDGVAQTIDPGLCESADDRRLGRPDTVSSHLVLLLPSTANVVAASPATAEIEALHDNFDAARGIATSAALGMSVWITIGTVVWWFVR